MRFYLAGSLVLAALAGCGRYYFAEREPWRKEAEVACLKSGSVKESQVLVRIEPIQGPGMCGADFPLKVAALGDDGAIGYADDVRPPGAIPNGTQPRWPIAEPRYTNPYGASRPSPPAYEPQPVPPSRGAVESAPARFQAEWAPVSRPESAPTIDSGARTADKFTQSAQGLIAPAKPVPTFAERAPGAPMRISPPGLEPPRSPEGSYDRSYLRAAPAAPAPAAKGARRPSVFDAPRGAPDDDDLDDMPARTPQAPPRIQNDRRPYERPATVPLGRNQMITGSIGPVEVKPAATLACPIVSALDQWIASAVQPAAKRWFGQPVAEIKQISAYSCRGMNGQPGARISEHAFGNALDIAAFILADGRRLTVKDGWRGTPEEQGFLRDIQGAACEQFTTVLAPGSNRFHYDHIHVDLMRRPSGRVVCNPDAISGDVVAARVAKERRLYARRGDPSITGSIGPARKPEDKKAAKSILKKFQVPEEDDEDDWIEDDGPRPAVN